MGAWGYKPMDSDQALDWLASCVTDRVGMEVENLLDNFAQLDPDAIYDLAYELRAAADVVLKLNFFTRFADLHDRLAGALTVVRDSAWPDDWNDPDRMRSELTAQIEALERGPQGTTMFDNLSGQ